MRVFPLPSHLSMSCTFSHRINVTYLLPTLHACKEHYPMWEFLWLSASLSSASRKHSSSKQMHSILQWRRVRPRLVGYFRWSRAKTGCARTCTVPLREVPMYLSFSFQSIGFVCSWRRVAVIYEASSFSITTPLPHTSFSEKRQLPNILLWWFLIGPVATGSTLFSWAEYLRCALAEIRGVHPGVPMHPTLLWSLPGTAAQNVSVWICTNAVVAAWMSVFV